MESFDELIALFFTDPATFGIVAVLWFRVEKLLKNLRERVNEAEIAIKEIRKTVYEKNSDS